MTTRTLSASRAGGSPETSSLTGHGRARRSQGRPVAGRPPHPATGRRGPSRPVRSRTAAYHSRLPIALRGDRDRDRPRQARPPRLLLRRHRRGALAAHPRPRGGVGRLADRRLPLRHPGHRGADGLGDVARDRDRARPARRAAACSTSRACGPATRTRRRCSPRSPRSTRRVATARMQEIYARRDPARADHRAAAPGPRGGRHRRRRAHARSAPSSSGRPSSTPASTCSSSAAPRSAPSTCPAAPSRSTSSGSSTSSTCPSSSAARASYTAALHLMRTGAAGVLVGFGGGAAHTTRAHARHPRADGQRDRRRRRRPPRLPRRVRRPLRARHRRRRHGRQRRHRQGGRLRRRRRDARRRARPRHRGPGPRAATGVPRRTTPSCRAASGSRSAPLGAARADPVRPGPHRRRHDAT